MAKKKNKDNDIGTVLVFMQAPFLLRAEEEEVQGEKRRGAGLLSPSHVLLARPVIRYMVSNCQFIFLLRDSENDPYPKKPLPKKKKTKQATQKNTCHIFLPQKVPKRSFDHPPGAPLTYFNDGGVRRIFLGLAFRPKGIFLGL